MKDPTEEEHDGDSGMTLDPRRSEPGGSPLCAASIYLVATMTINLLNLTHTIVFLLVAASLGPHSRAHP